MWQNDFLIWMTSFQNPFLNGIAYFFTFLGNEPFYFLVIPLVYWCFSKRVGFRLLYIFLSSIYINEYLKYAFPHTRPIGTEGVKSIFVESAQVGGGHYPHNSFPSGHAQGATTLWSYLATVVQRPYFWLFAMILIFLISISRLYTGVHWPTDVIGGMLIAVVIVRIGIRVEKNLTKASSLIQWLLVIIVPFIMWLFLAEGVKYAGFLLGSGIAYLLEREKVRMRISDSYIKRGMAYAVGLISLAAVQVTLKFLFPEVQWADFVRYVLIGTWGFIGVPYLFIKLRIYDQAEPPIQKNQPPIQM